MKTYSADWLRRIGRRIFEACGAPPEEAAVVAEVLVDASLMGLDSHGIVRIPQYVEEVLKGKIVPGAPVRVTRETRTTAIVDCGFNFGPVSAMRMVDIACEKARASSIAYVVSQNCHHISRLGAYVQSVAERGMFGFATCNSSKHGHWVVPWGGREGRLATNPLAYAAPTSGAPVVMDMSTSMISEGKVRVLMHQNLPVPEGCIQDARGNPTTDPMDFYGPPHGTILPFGSELGYKGFGLGLLVEILSGTMADMTTSADYPYINGFALLVIDPCAYVTSSPPAPGHNEVVIPGAYDFRTMEKRSLEGIPIDDQTWRLIVDTARSVDVDVTDETVRQTELAPS